MIVSEAERRQKTRAGEEQQRTRASAHNALLQLAGLGQSCWLDDLTRRMIETGELAGLVAEGVAGITANPATFAKSIINGKEYTTDIERGTAAGLNAEAIYEQLATTDVRNACDILRPVYDKTDGVDGFVSLEVSPHLAHDTAGSVAAAKRLWVAVDRPNLFIKIPGTAAGVPAIEEALTQGINVNITLLFSVERYEAAAHAYLRALERRAAADKPIDRIASVASFFLSRIDVLVDALLQQRIEAVPANVSDPKALLGKVAVANAKLAYQSFQQLFAGAKWEKLANCGARLQRLLWASTGVKNPAYPELMYVEPLIGPMTVNTMPANTISAFEQHGRVRETVGEGIEEAHRVMAQLRAPGIDFAEVAAQLEAEGIQKFVEPYSELMRYIETKCQA